MRTRTVLLLLLGVFLAACTRGTEVPQKMSDEAVIALLTAQADRFSQAYMDGDADAMTAIYTDDAVIFPNNAEYIRGKEAIRAYWVQPEGQRVTYHKITAVEVIVDDSLASDFGHYEVSGVSGENAWGPTSGKYVVVWKLGKDGVWRMHLDMWNSRPQP